MSAPSHMDWPDTLDLTLDGIAQGGEGVGHWHGRPVFVKGGLPGERVQVRVHQRHATYARGVTAAILDASPDRVPPRIPDADHMPWQHIAYQAQLRFKRQIVQDQLRKIAGLEHGAVEATLPAARPWEYRNSARFHVAGGRIGYYKAGSHELEPISADPLLLPVLNDALAALRPLVRTNDRLTEIVLRASETHGYAIAELRGSGDLRGLARRWRERCPILAGVVLPGAPPAGADHLVEEMGGSVFILHPSTFFQVNLAAAATLLHLVREALAPRGDERLFDLYCGVGTFALPLAALVAEVVGVEEHHGAVADAQTSAAENRVANVRFMVGRVEHVLATLAAPCGAVVLDPPRRGCHPQALEELLRLAPPRIVYVSCHPATLARDLKRLVAGGYRVVRVQPVDLFPQTAHIENVCVLVRAQQSEGHPL